MVSMSIEVPRTACAGDDLDRCLKIIAGTGEPVMGQDIDLDEQVPVVGAVIAGFPIPLHAEAHPVINPGRDMDGNFPFHPGMTGTPAFLTDFFRDLSPPFALRAGCHPDELPERGTCSLPHLA